MPRAGTEGAWAMARGLVGRRARNARHSTRCLARLNQLREFKTISALAWAVGSAVTFDERVVVGWPLRWPPWRGTESTPYPRENRSKHELRDLRTATLA